MKIANLFEDKDLLKLSQEAAKIIINEGISNYPLLQERCRKLIPEDIVMN